MLHMLHSHDISPQKSPRTRTALPGAACRYSSPRARNNSGMFQDSCLLWSYPLVNVYITMENHHAINGKIHYKWSFSIAMLNF